MTCSFICKVTHFSGISKEYFAVVHSEETAVAASERIVNDGGFQSVSGVNNCVVSTYFKIKSFEMLRPVESELRIPFRLPCSQLYYRFFRIVNVDHQKKIALVAVVR